MRELDWTKIWASSVDGKGLLPVVVQDSASKRNLMLVFMDELAYKKTMETGFVTVFSRKAQDYRVQGESRDCMLWVDSEQIGCGQNSLLLLVTAQGNHDKICHHGGTSCFEDIV